MRVIIGIKHESNFKKVVSIPWEPRIGMVKRLNYQTLNNHELPTICVEVYKLYRRDNQMIVATCRSSSSILVNSGFNVREEGLYVLH